MKTKKNINLFIHSLVCMLIMLTGIMAQTAPSNPNKTDENSSLSIPNSPFPVSELPVPPIPQPELPGTTTTSRARSGTPEASKANQLMTLNNLGIKADEDFLTSANKDSSQSTMSLTGNYTMTDLGTVGNCVNYYPQKVNNNGDVIGYCYDQNYGYHYAFLYRNGQLTLLTLGGTYYSFPSDINENGDVVGYAYTAGNQYQHAFLYRNGQMIDLGTLGGAHSSANAINENGDVVGYANTAGNQYHHAFLYRNGQMIDLGTLGGTYSNAHLLSENGDVAGWAYTANNQQHAFVYRNGQMIDLGTFGGTHSYANAINNNGDVVGRSYTANNQYERAFLYRNGQMIDLGTLGGAHSYANAINNNGDVAGWAYTANNQQHAFLYRNGQMIDLGTFGGTYSYANAINNNGDVVGYAYTAGNQYQRAFLYRNGQMIDLGTLGGTHSSAHLLSENGDVAGWAYTANNQYRRVFVYRNGQMIDLGTLGGTYSEARAINNNGDVIGSSYTTNNQQYRGFIARTNTNTAPTAVADAFPTNEDTLLTVPASGVLNNDDDEDDDALTVELVSGPANASSFTLIADGSFSYMPNSNFNGTDSFTYKATDGRADSNTVTVTITVNALNDAPSLGNVPTAATIDEMIAYGFTATASDIDNAGQTLTFSLSDEPAGASINPANGQFTWTPTEAQGVIPNATNFFRVHVSDGVEDTIAYISLTVREVNVAPTLSNVPAAMTIDELAAYQFTAASTDADFPVQTLTFSLVNPPAGASIDSETGAFTWTPSEAQGNGSTYTFAVRVSDGVVNTDSSIALTVSEVNSAPSLAAIGDQTVDELTALSGVAAVGTDSDDPANTLTYSLDAGFPEGMTINSATGAISWTPTELQGAGDYPVTVRVTDDGNLSATRSFNVQVKEVNVAPELGAIGSSTIDEQAAFGFTATATDADLKTDNTPANNLTFSLENAPAGAAITANGVFSWTPTEAQGPGSYTFKVKVSDDGSPALADQETITLTVREVNLPPVLGTINNQTGYWGNAFGFRASATDPDLPDNTLTYSLVNAPAGASIDSATGVFTWTPLMSQIAAHTFIVVVTDDGTPAMSDSQNVTITVGKRPTTIVYNGDSGEQYSDQQALSATLTDTGFGTPLAGKTVRFDIGSQNVSSLTDVAGAAAANLILTQDPNPGYNVVSQFAGDEYYLAATLTDTFDIRHEDARAYYTGTLFVNTACATCGNATATLSATVKDITAESSDPAADSFEGDIRNATVTFVNRDTNPNTPIAGCSNLPVGLVNLGDKKVGTATCNWNASINGDSMDYTIGIVVNNFYARNSGAEDTVVTISKPLGTNFITGGGFLVNELSNGQYSGVAGLKTNLGFNVKYNKSGTSLQGRVNVIVRGSNGRVYQIKGNVMRTLSVRTVTSNPLVRAATYTGKANLTDITDPLNPLALGGNNSFQMDMTDKGEPGSSDMIGINVWNDAGGLLFSSRWNGTRTVEQLLGGGNLVVR